MKVTNIKNVSNGRVSVLCRNGMEISLPPGEGYEDNLDITNIDALGEKVSYTADLTEVGKPSKSLQRLDD